MEKLLQSWWKWFWGGGGDQINPSPTLSSIIAVPSPLTSTISSVVSSFSPQFSIPSSAISLPSSTTSISSTLSYLTKTVKSTTLSSTTAATTTIRQRPTTWTSPITISPTSSPLFPVSSWSSRPPSSSSSFITTAITSVTTSPIAKLTRKTQTAATTKLSPLTKTTFNNDIQPKSTISSILSSLINNTTINNNNNSNVSNINNTNNNNSVYVNQSISSIYGNISILPTNHLTEDDLLFGILSWNNSTIIDQQTEIDLIYGGNFTGINNNGTSNNGGDIIQLINTWELISTVVLAVVLGFVILATVIGNVFVIAAILLERNLQSVANYLILSLAVADLLVACLVMPLSAVYEVSQEWKLGPELCDMWTSCDVLCCTASILHLVAIALDRYWAVTNIDYVHQRTGRRIGFMIFVIWFLSFLVSIAPLLGWKDTDWNERIANELKCIVSQDIGYQIFATASSFYVPLLVILVLYWRIFQTARKRIRRRQQAATQTHPEPLANASCLALTAIGFRWKVTATQPTSGGLIATAAGGSGGIAAAVVTVIGRPLPTISETTTAFTNISSTNTSPEKGSYGNGVDRIENDPPTADISVAYPSQGQQQQQQGGQTPSNISSSIKPSSGHRKQKAQTSVDSKRERKAAKTLAIITGAFVCCWLPFFIIAILVPACNECNISELVMSLFLWLGYFNSTLNPIIYTIFSPEFRHAFKRILCGRQNSIRRRNRHMGVMRR